MINIEGLTKRFSTQTVLDGVNHRQDRGQSVVLIGPSGCGKTTFLRCLNQLETPDAGRITIGYAVCTMAMKRVASPNWVRIDGDA